ncbi:MAG: hypothetical protein IJV54_08585 [Bacteroidales bacterium]|nr:hypothetical protein [Bacteroidales bacterium]
MKTTYLSLCFLAAATMTLGVSCEKEESFTLEDTVYMDKVLLAQGEGFNDELYSFDMEFAGEGVSGQNGSYTGTGEVVSLKMFGSKYYLDASIYSPVEAGGEKDYSYRIDESRYYTVSNGQVTEKKISKGYVNITKEDNSYRIGSTLTLENGETLKFIAHSDIVFPKLPKYKYMGNFIQAYDAGEVYIVEFANGTAKMGDGKMEGSGTVVHIEWPGLHSLEDGVYAPGDYKKGFLNDTYAAWGAVWDEGSRFHEIADGNQSTSGYITDATITVSTLADSSRRIEVDMDDVVYIYEGHL